MALTILAALALAWAATGVVIGLRRSDVVSASAGGWAILVVLWAFFGPFAARLPRG